MNNPLLLLADAVQSVPVSLDWTTLLSQQGPTIGLLVAFSVYLLKREERNEKGRIERETKREVAACIREDRLIKVIESNTAHVAASSEILRSCHDTCKLHTDTTTAGRLAAH